MTALLVGRGGRASWDLLAALSLFAVALVAYLAFPTAHYSYDAVAGGILLYQWIASGDLSQLFHRYHVLYLPLAAGVERALRGIGVDLDPLTLMQLMGTAFAASSVALYYRLARALELARPLAIALSILLGGGFGFWYYATTGESYPISFFFLLLAFLSALRSRGDCSWARASVTGVWLGLAAGFHGTCLLALPGLAVMIWPGGRDRAAYGRVAATVLGAGLTLAVPYAVRYATTPRSNTPSGPAADVAALAREEGWSIRPRVIAEWKSLARSMAPTDWPSVPSSHPLLARASHWGLLAVSLFPLALLVGVERGRRKSVLALAVWFAACFLFFSAYFAESPKFASYQWIPLLLLAGLALQRTLKRPPALLAGTAIVATLVAVTLYASFDLVRRQTDPASNPHLARALAIARLTTSDDLIVHLGQGENLYQKVYTPYFAVRRSLVLERFFEATRPDAGPSLHAFEAHLASFASGPGRIVVLSDAVEEGSSSREFEKRYVLPDGSIARLFAARGPQLLADDPAAGRVYVLTAAASPR